MVLHTNGTPMHYSRTPSSWIHDHRPSGTPYNTASNWRQKSFNTPLAFARGACYGLAPGSSNLCLLLALSSPVGLAPASSLRRLSPRWSHEPLTSWRSNQLHLSPSRTHIYTHNKQTIASTSIHT